MPTYTLDSIAGSIYDEAASDGSVEKLIDLTIAVLEDGIEVGRISKRFSYDLPNAEIREALLVEIREIVASYYEELERQAEADRLAAIQSAIETWSKTLP